MSPTEILAPPRPKRNRAGLFASAEEVRRFQAEAESAAGLDHFGIVPVYEVGEQQGQHFIAMRFVDGFSRARLRRQEDDHQ